MKYDTEQSMKLESLYKVGSECELNSLPDSSVGQSVSTDLIACGFKSRSCQLFIAISKNSMVNTICIYIYIYIIYILYIYIYIYIYIVNQGSSQKTFILFLFFQTELRKENIVHINQGLFFDYPVFIFPFFVCILFIIVFMAVVAGIFF